MSDYLWDKTGDREAEVERLEELLGGLRYRPQEFELPAEVVADKPERRAFGHALRPYFAVAAALLLMLFVGLWLGVLRRDGAGEVKRVAVLSQPASPEHSQTPDGNRQDETTTSMTGDAGREEQVAEKEQKTHDPARRNRRDTGRRVFAKHDSPVTTTAHDDGGIAHVKVPKGSGGSAHLNAVAYSVDEQQQAKAQLMYALRLTSAKLGEVQHRTRESDDEKSVPFQRNINR